MTNYVVSKNQCSLYVYMGGGQDTFSGKINFLRIWTTNNKPEVIGRFYFDYLSEGHGKLILFM